MDDPEMSETSSHSGSASVGVMSTTLMLGCAIFVGPLVTRYGGRPVTLAGAILIAMGLFTASYARSVFHLYFTYSLLSGVGFSLMFAPCVMIVSLWFSRRRTLAVGMSVAGSGIGTLVIAQISERLIDAFGWRGALVYLSVGTGIANVASALTFYSPETSDSNSTSSTKKHQDDGKTLLDDDSCAVNSTEMVEVRLHGGDAHVNAEDDYESSAAGQEKNAGKERGGQGGQGVRTRNGKDDVEKAEGKKVVGREKALTMRELGQHPSFVPLMWLSFFFAGFMWVPYIYLPAFQFDALGTPLKQGAQTVASIGIFSTFGRIVIGRIAMYYSVIKCLHACCFISGAAVCLLALVPSAPFLIWVFAMAFGLSAGSVIALFGPVIIDLVGIQNLPNGYGFLCTVQAPGVLAIPAVCGMLHDAFGSYIAIWVVSGLGMMASSMFLFMVKHPTTALPHGQA
jgi:MFS family permease